MGEAMTRGVIAFCTAICAATAVRASEPPKVRPTISVPDMIRMRAIGDPAQGRYSDQDPGYFSTQWSNGHQAEFSPNGKHVAIIVRWGDLKENQTRAQVWTYDVRSLFSGAPHTLVASAASTSNRPPIEGVRWLADNRTIAYLAERPHALPQVFLTDTVTGRTTQLTHSPELIATFDITPSGKRVAFLARPVRGDARAGLSDYGNVRDLDLTDLLMHWPEVDYSRQLSHLFVQDVGQSRVIPIPDPRVASLVGSRATDFLVGRCNPWWGGVSISPDGHYAVRTCTLAGIPKSWRRFEPVAAQIYSARSLGTKGLDEMFDRDLEFAIERETPAGASMPVGMAASYVGQNVEVDLASGQYFVTLDAPLSVAAWAMEQPRAWLPSGHTLIFTNSLAPEPERLPLLTHQSNLITVNLANGHARVEPILTSEGFPTAVRWDYARDGLSVDFNGASRKFTNSALYTYAHSRWVSRAGSAAIAANSNGAVRMYVMEGLNEPPLLMAENILTGKSAEILDVDPFLHGRRIGDIRFITWTRGATTWSARIYYPPDYHPGYRYPLVIQTHGFSDGRRFTLDGDATSGMAAEPLAAAGMVVVQLGTYDDQVVRRGQIRVPQDILRAERHWIEALIDSLSARGIVDRKRVGLSAWSATCFGVKYFLTHSRYPIAAALIDDGYDGGYVQYVTSQSAQEEMEARDAWGSKPYGVGLLNWLNRASDFRLQDMRTPVRIEANKPSGLVWQWETFAGLSRLGYPVVLHYLPDGAHEEVRPKDWYASAQGAVDWYRFWLLNASPGELRTASAATWRRLRRQYGAMLAGGRPARIRWQLSTFTR
jgi:dipeptidyl aminopeptidase/acylaminoacyl peptidase